MQQTIACLNACRVLLYACNMHVTCTTFRVGLLCPGLSTRYTCATRKEQKNSVNFGRALILSDYAKNQVDIELYPLSDNMHVPPKRSSPDACRVHVVCMHVACMQHDMHFACL